MTVSGDPGLGDGRKSAEWGGGVAPTLDEHPARPPRVSGT